jgi:hypothetical protein
MPALTPESGIKRGIVKCPLWARSGLLQQDGFLFDHLVGYRLNLPRNCETERLRGLEIDH